MRFYADLHIHSKYSRATSKQCDLENLALWACRKGIQVVGTGDFTHPAWRAELKEQLVPAEPGLFRLRDDIQRAVLERLPRSCQGTVRFLLSTEISTIYKKGEKTRKVHHLVYAPDFDAAEAVTNRLLRAKCNLHADGRPIIGLDSRHLLEIVLESSPGSYLVPAHVWTPWFAVLGSRSGFDRVADCYGDLAHHIFAIETGLSSDPEMNWRLSQLDRYTLVSNSDAHSPAKLGREACVFDCALDYFAMRNALETRRGFAGTVEFFPEEGKYHLDGHRKCGVVFEPAQTREHSGLCPACQQPLTVGVMHRVQELADRPPGFQPADMPGYRSLVPLPEVLAEIARTGPDSKTVSRSYEYVLSRLGGELFVLEQAPLEEIARMSSPFLAEALARMRAGTVIRQAGYDGEYGVIRLFEEDELPRSLSTTSELIGSRKKRAQPGLPGFHELDMPLSPAEDADSHLPAERARAAPEQRPARSASTAAFPAKAGSLLDQAETTAPDAPLSPRLAALDPEQRAAAAHVSGPLLIVAGPGTGKTRTLTHRIAHLIADHGAKPESCLAITFTSRAAEEMRVRLYALLGDDAGRIPVLTFHALALSMLKEHREAAGLARGFAVASSEQGKTMLMNALGCSERKAMDLLARISVAKRRRSPAEGGPGSSTGQPADGDGSGELATAMDAYRLALEQAALIDFDDLLVLALGLVEAEPDLRAMYQARFGWISIDEYQDIDELQYQLMRCLCPPRGNLCAIGDPDQAIYSFRGADVGYFLRFREDFPGAHEVRLTRNYRSTSTIVTAAMQVIAPSSLVAGRALTAVRGAGRPIVVHEAASAAAEAELITHTIESLIGGTSFFSLDSGRVFDDGSQDPSNRNNSDEPGNADNDDGQLGFGDFAVLYRTESQAQELVVALSRAGIPLQKRSHRTLLGHARIAAVMDRLATHRIADLELHPEAAKDQLVAAVRAIAAELVVPAPVPSPAGTDAAEAQDSAERAAEAEREAVIEMLTALAKRAGGDVDRFYAELTCGMEVDTLDAHADRVSLLTLHAAKGLEFPVVFIAGCEDSIVPLRREDSNIEEERRLFFVGMTRAERRLYLTRASRRTGRGPGSQGGQRGMQASEMQPSPFLADIDPALTQAWQGESRRARKKPKRRQLTLF